MATNPQDFRSKLAAKDELELEIPGQSHRLRSRESKLAHHYLDGLQGIEIGGSAHNAFGLQTLNIDYCADRNTVFKQEEVRVCGQALPVDVVANGDTLPFQTGAWDFVINSHVIEHFFDPIKTLKEWLRVVKDGGFIFLIVPHKARTFDANRECTSLTELIERHSGSPPSIDLHTHYSVWITEDFLELCDYLELNIIDYLDVDDKVGNGFTIVLQKAESLSALLSAADLAVSAGKLEESIKILSRARNRYPEEATVYQFLANLWSLKGDYQMAREIMSQALEREPENITLINQYGTILFHIGDRKGSIEAYQRALRADPNCVDAQNNLIQVLEQGQSNPSAKDHPQPRAASIEYAWKTGLGPQVSSLPRIAFYGAREVSTPIRMGLPAKALSALGCKTLLATEFRLDDLNDYDVFVFCRPNLNELAAEGLWKCSQSGKTVIVDLDDNFHAIPGYHPANKLCGPGNPRSLHFLENCISKATVLTVSTQPLGTFYGRLNANVRVIPNGWSGENKLWIQPAFQRDTLNLGWAGTITHRKDVLEMRQGVTRILQEFPHTRLVIGGDREIPRLFSKSVQKQIIFLDQVDYAHYPNILANFDILLAPLVIDAFNQTKSDIKLLEAGIRKIPWVASPAQLYQEWELGGLFAQTPPDWYLQLKCLIDDPGLRTRLGEAGHQKALTRESSLNVEHWLRLLEELGFPIPGREETAGGENGKSSAITGNPVEEEQARIAAARLLDEILANEEPMMALQNATHRFSPHLVELVRENAGAARQNGDADLAEGLVILSDYIEAAMTYSSSGNP